MRELVIECLLTLVRPGLGLLGIAEDLRRVLLDGFSAFFGYGLSFDLDRPSGGLSLAAGGLDDGCSLGLCRRDGFGSGRRDEQPGGDRTDDGCSAGDREILGLDRERQWLMEHVTPH